MPKFQINAERLRSLIHYDPNTGEFTWLVKKGTKAAGSFAGAIHRTGYRVIRIDRRDYRAGRLAWMYMTGAWPAQLIDHKNGLRSDDRFLNLREATSAQNCANAASKNRKTDGPRGAHFHKQSGRWLASIQANKVNRHLGSFQTKEQAGEAYAAAAKAFHGEFSRITA